MDENFGSMARQMGKILDQLNKGFYSFYPNETWTPNVNLYESEDAYMVAVDLAGVEKDKIEIEVVQNRRLLIKGTRTVPMFVPQPAGSEQANRQRTRVHLMEIDHGGFARAVELPHDVATGRISADHRNGILWIEIPKR